MKETLKIFLIYLSRFLLSIFHLFPIKKNRILFISFSGSNYNCNPKYIYQELLKHNCNYEYIWVLNNNLQELNSCKIIPYKSLKFYYYFLTSKLIISNYSVSPKLPVRKKQILFNTWHGGGAYKKVGVTKVHKEQKRIRKVFDILSKETSYFLSSCKIDSKTIMETFYLPKEKVLDLGYPRNDIFFDKSVNSTIIREKICKQLSINPDDKILLIAPTFKGEPGFGKAKDNFSLDINKICSALSEKYNGHFICIYRGHYYVNKQIPENCINGNDYPDMQELLLISDVLITDYSSAIWDYSFTYKPCFLYVPDLIEYSKTQEFYVPIEKWGFTFALTEDELIKNIKEYNVDTYIKNIEEAHNYYGAFDDGKASFKVFEKINNFMK